MSNGIIYCAVGDKFVKMAARSAETVRETTPGAQITLVTDKESAGGVFDEIALVPPGPNRHVKTNIGVYSSYDSTLYLDCDTIVVSDLSPVFDFLQDFDLAVVLSQRSRLKYYPPNSLTVHGLTGEHPHFASGVFGFSSRVVPDFFDFWLAAYKRTQHVVTFDQLSFSATILRAMKQGRTVMPLPSVWNVRPLWGDSVCADVKVFHTPQMDQDLSLQAYLSNRETLDNPKGAPRWVKHGKRTVR